MPVQVHIQGLADQRLPTEIETTVYRVVQEALTNVGRHARATRVSLVLQCDNRELALVIEDNGRGFAAEEAFSAISGERRLGLLGMRERVSLASGTFEIESSAGSGTSLYVRIPLQARSPEVNS